jgi:hypothetical protein
MIERAARDPSIDVDKLDRLLTMRERDLARVAEQAWKVALSAAQAEMEPIRADARNDQTRSHYASHAALDGAIRPIYTRHGFGLTFDTDDAPRELEARIVCDVCHAGGHTRRYRLDMPVDGKGARGGDVMTRTHAVGSGITYDKRYLLGMIFNLAVCKDDDGNAAGSLIRPGTAERRIRTIVPAPKHALKAGGIAERAITKRYEAAVRSVGPSQPFLAGEAGKGFYDERNPPPHDTVPEGAREAAREINRRLHPMDDELPGDLGPPKLDRTERDGIPSFLDRRKANGGEPSYLDLVGG